MPTNTGGRAPIVSSGRPPGAPTLPAPVTVHGKVYATPGLRLHRAPAPPALCSVCLAPHKPGKPHWLVCGVCGCNYPPTAAVHCAPPVVVARTFNGVPSGRTAPTGPMPYVAPGSKVPRARGSQLPNRTLRRPKGAKAPKGQPAPPHMAKGSIAPANRH